MIAKQNMSQYTVVVKNEPGQLHRITQALGREQINILGITIEILGDVCHVCFIAEKSQNVRQALEKLSINTFETSVYCIALQNRPGELARLTKVMAENDVNIKTLYGTADGQEEARLVLAVDRPEKIEKVMAGFAEALAATAR